jgi:hypothetical protein
MWLPLVRFPESEGVPTETYKPHEMESNNYAWRDYRRHVS